MDVSAVLTELRQAVEQARSMPMSASVVVNRSELLSKIDRLEDEMHRAFGEADRIQRERDDVLAEGRAQAEQILAEARSERDRLVSDTEVFRLAQHRADEILAEASADAEGLRKETDDYVDGTLANFEITLERTMEAVKRGRDRLAGRSALDSLTEAEADKIKLPEHLEG